MKLGIETTPTRRLLYQVGLVTGDGSAAAHLAWAKGKSREFDIVSAQAQAAAFGGRMHEAVELYQRARDLAFARGLNGTASGLAVHIAWTNALYLTPKETAASVKRLIGQDKPEADTPGLPRFRAPAALALAGLVNEAQALVAGTGSELSRGHIGSNSADTLHASRDRAQPIQARMRRSRHSVLRRRRSWVPWRGSCRCFCVVKRTC